VGLRERLRSSSELRAKVRRWALVLALVDALALLGLTRGRDWYYDPRGSNPPGHVVVYTTRWCPVCERLRQCLRQHAVPFEERDVEGSRRAAAEWSALGGSGVPVTLAGREVVLGMRPEELRSALAGAGFQVDCRAGREPAAPR
jgi:glutaredoxin